MALTGKLEAYVRLHIPLSTAMGVSVLEANDERVRLGFPLEPNRNHRQTVFGGSESSAAILAAWSLLWVRLSGMETRPRLVIMANTMEYARPVTSDFEACTEPIDAHDWDRFLAGIERKGMGRIRVRAVVATGGILCGEFSGVFVGMLV